jgi:hypothetical protein
MINSSHMCRAYRFVDCLLNSLAPNLKSAGTLQAWLFGAGRGFYSFNLPAMIDATIPVNAKPIGDKSK